MTRVGFCVLVLGATAVLLSCGPANRGDADGGTGSAGAGAGGTAGVAGGTGTGVGGTTGVAGWAGTGLGGTAGFAGAPPIAGRGGAPPVAGRGGSAPATAGTTGTGGSIGDGGQCPGLNYFVETGRCAATFDAQAAKDFKGSCWAVIVRIGRCGDYQVWGSGTRPGHQSDPLTCVYDAAGNLVGAQVCTDHSAWPCAGGLGLCLTVGPVANVGPCTLPDACEADGGAGG